MSQKKMLGFSKEAKKHYRARFEHEKDIPMKKWCREVHADCEACQNFVGRFYNPVTAKWQDIPPDPGM